MRAEHEVLEHLLVDLLWKVGIVMALVVAVGLACWRIAAHGRDRDRHHAVKADRARSSL